ncbi:MAG: DUF3108 domain-containing protein [Alphaproteobacteria bacterium]|nr:DUF3108 domain-containing protein [Alphaproteobacteria bacterium]
MAAVEERVLAEREVSRDWKPPPPVPNELRVGVFDPLTAIRESIAHVRAHLGGGPARFKIPVFDGTRRFDIAYEFRGRSARSLGKNRYDTYWVRMTPQPMAGFSARNLEFWEGAAFDIYLDRDADLVPVQIMPLENGPVLNLVETCATACPLPEAERS